MFRVEIENSRWERETFEICIGNAHLFRDTGKGNKTITQQLAINRKVIYKQISISKIERSYKENSSIIPNMAII